MTTSKKQKNRVTITPTVLPNNHHATRDDVSDIFKEDGDVLCNVDARCITISGAIAHPRFSQVDLQLTELEVASSRKPITIRISSIGGDVNEALAIVGRIRRSPCKIITEGYGLVASCATLIFAAGDEKLFSKYGWFMHHLASFNFNSSIKFVDLKRMLKQATLEEHAWAVWMSELTNKDLTFWKKLGDDGTDIFLSPRELLDLGIIDKILEEQ